MRRVAGKIRELLSDEIAVNVTDARLRDVKASEVPVVVQNMPLIFVDGGQGMLFASSLLCIARLRVVAMRFDDALRHDWTRRLDILCIAYLAEEKIELAIDIEHDDFGLSISPFSLDVHDPELCGRNAEVSLEQGIGLFRRLCELQVAAGFSEPVCIDGALRSAHTRERDIIEGMQEVYGFCKTYRFVPPMIQGVGIRLIAEPRDEQGVYVWAVRLHARSRHVFMVESLTKELPILGGLAAHASDPRFFGYPYGLIKVDRVARVGNAETERERSRLMFDIGDVSEKLVMLEGSRNAHSVLDHIYANRKH